MKVKFDRIEPIYIDVAGSDPKPITSEMFATFNTKQKAIVRSQQQETAIAQLVLEHLNSGFEDPFFSASVNPLVMYGKHTDYGDIRLYCFDHLFAVLEVKEVPHFDYADIFIDRYPVKPFSKLGVPTLGYLLVTPDGDLRSWIFDKSQVYSKYGYFMTKPGNLCDFDDLIWHISQEVGRQMVSRYEAVNAGEKVITRMRKRLTVV